MALHYLAGLPIEEIARRTGRPSGTIKRWLHGGRRRLADELEEYAPMKRREALKLLAATPMAATTLGAGGQPAPKPAVNAAIISSELPPDLLKKMVDAARAAGFDRVVTLDAPPSMEATGEGESREVHVPVSLKDVSVVVLDEWIGGRSAFEVLVSLKAAVEAKQMAFFMLAASPKDSTVFAAHAAGVDCFLTKPFDLAEFQKFMQLLRERGRPRRMQERSAPRSPRAVLENPPSPPAPLPTLGERVPRSTTKPSPPLPVLGEGVGG